MFKGLDGTQAYFRFDAKGRFVPCAPPRKPTRIVGRVVNVDRERGVVTFVAEEVPDASGS